MTTRGESELIGLILMTALVIGAVTLVGTIFLDNLNRSIEHQEPNVDIEGELNGSNAIITHQSGNDLPFSELELRLRSDGTERVYALSDAGDLNATVGDGDEIFESGEKVIVDHDFTGDVRILLVETTDPGYLLFDKTLAFEKTGPKTEPTIEEFEITDTSDNLDASFDVTWNASDLQGDITEVTTKLINDGVVEDSNSTPFSNRSTTGVHNDTLTNASGSGTSYKIQLSVTDAEGNTVSESKVANAESEIGLRSPTIEQFEVSDISKGQDAIFDVTHNATDPDGDITELVVSLSDENTGAEVENATYTFNQTGVTGEKTDRLDDTNGKNKNELYRINISVKDSEGNTVTYSTTETADGDDAVGVLDEIEGNEVDTDSARIIFDVENTGSDRVEVAYFSVNATPISPDIWIDDGNKNNPEFITEGAQVDGNADSKERKEDSFHADGTKYKIKDYGKNPKIDPDDGVVTITFSAFGPDDKYISDSAELTFADSASEADITISLRTAAGGESTYYLQVEE